jgi:hypothetical protein
MPVEGMTFDHINTTWLAKYFNVSSAFGQPAVVSDSGRGSAKAATVSGHGSIQKTFAATSTPMFTGAFKIPAADSATACTLVTFLDSGTVQLRIQRQSDGTIRALRGDTQIGSPSVYSTVSEAYYGFAVVATIHPSAGTVDVYINGNPTPILSLTGQNTRATANSTANSWRIGGVSADGSRQVYWKDVCWATAGAFLGDLKVRHQFGTADGHYTDLTPSTGTASWPLVDDAAPDISDKLSGLTGKVTLLFDPLDYTPDVIHAVGTEVVVWKSDTGDRFWRDLFRKAGVDYDGPPAAMSTTELIDVQWRHVDPATTTTWTKSGLDGYEQGVEIT